MCRVSRLSALDECRTGTERVLLTHRQQAGHGEPKVPWLAPTDRRGARPSSWQIHADAVLLNATPSCARTGGIEVLTERGIAARANASSTRATDVLTKYSRNSRRVFGLMRSLLTALLTVTEAARLDRQCFRGLLRHAWAD